MPIPEPEWEIVFSFVYESLNLNQHGRPVWPIEINYILWGTLKIIEISLLLPSSISMLCEI